MQGVGAVVGVLTGAEQLPPKQQALPSPHTCCFRTLPHLSCSPRLFAPSARLPTPGRPVSRRRRRGASGPPRCTPASPSRQSSSRSTRTRPARRCSGTWTASLRASSPGARRDTSESFPSHLLDASWTPPRKLARRATASHPTPHLGHRTATSRTAPLEPAPRPRLLVGASSARTCLRTGTRTGRAAEARTAARTARRAGRAGRGCSR